MRTVAHYLRTAKVVLASRLSAKLLRALTPSRCPGVAIARNQIRYCLVDWDALSSTLPYFPGDNGVIPGVVDNDASGLYFLQ